MSRQRSKHRRLWRLALGGVAVVLLGIASVPAGIEIAARNRAAVDLSKLTATSPLLLDAHGAWVDAALSPDDKWRFRATVEDAPPLYLDLLLAYEDHRFAEHSGVSYRAVARAVLASLRAGRIVSGASTLPMQVARLAEGQSPGLRGKISQAVAARRLVIDHDRDEILGLYLTLAPFGGNLEGIEAAALHYFGKRARDLNPAEAALLVAIPQAPEARRLDRDPAAAMVARAKVLKRGADIGVISDTLATELARAPVDIRPGRAFGASRAVLAALREVSPDATSFSTTLDADLQALLRRDLEKALAGKPDTVNAAALVIRNRDGAILAQVGNARGLDSPAGYLDLTTRSRSPGSALKPFIYGMAFDRGHAHPKTIFHDRAQRYGAFSPRNFGEAEPGPIDLRTALATSLNTAAVAVLNEVGPQAFIDQLRSTGVRIDLPEGAQDGPGLAVSLGGVGITLQDLAFLYVALANGGVTRELHQTPGAQHDAPPPVTLFGPGAAWAVTDALAGARPPDHGLPLKARNGALRVAYKTGTSSGRRDAWAVGYDRLHTVAVWIGRTDNGGMPGASGRVTAAPVLWSVFRALPRPEDGVIPDLPEADRHLGWQDPPLRLRVLGGDAQGAPLEIQFPQREGHVRRPAGTSKITLSLSGGTPPYSWIVNEELQPVSLSHELTVEVEPGPLTITVLDVKGARDSLQTWVE